MVIHNIAFITGKDSSDNNILRVIDLNNKNYVADFVYDNSIRRFNQVSSTFANGKRKYEALYLVERNTEELLEACENS